MNAYRGKRKRRTLRQVLKHGPSAKRAHAHPAGRTGKIRQKRLKAGRPKKR